MVRASQLVGMLVAAAYTAVLLVPCGGSARPLSETRVTMLCECPAHAAHGSVKGVPLELAKLPLLPAPPPRAPLSTRLASSAPGLPAPPWLGLPPPVPRAPRLALAG